VWSLPAESTKGMTVHRTTIRGIICAAIAAACAAVPAVAIGATGTDWNQPLSVAEQRAALHWTFPRVPFLRHLRPRTPEQFARDLLARRGWGAAEWSCLDALWTRESGWETQAQNASGAYGIPQALPAGKMAAAGADWRTNPRTQIRWGLSYIAAAYGDPCTAWQHSQSYGYY
jgi:hypothetical protein